MTLLLWVSSLMLSVTLSHKVAPTYHSVRSGWISDNSEYNWPVGVHKEINVKEEYEHICGGSLISATLILSAAHCFWKNGEGVDLDKYRVTVGNFYRIYDFATPDSRKRIKKLVFHERYRGSELNHAHDIVIVQIEARVTFDKRVGPISIDWNYSFRDKQLVGRSGTVLGWGFTEFSFSRIAAQLPYIPFGRCWNEVPPKFHSSITPDKFCAGLRNGTTVFPGDSGSGLAFYNSTAKKWYLRGIVSVGVLNPRTKGCGTNDFSVFTSIRFYLSWLLEMIPLLVDNNNNNNTESNFENDRSHNSVYH